MRILVAEDDFTSRTILKGILKKNGYEAVEAANGFDAWQIMQKGDAPAIALVDWMMPEMDGLELLHKIRSSQTEKAPYIIMLTGKTEKSDIITALENGADDYIKKPFDFMELKARVDVGRRIIEMQEALIEGRKKLYYQATHDPLTGLLNRRAIFEKLGEELQWCMSGTKALAIGVCDIDHFKNINDQYGHQTGDEVLCRLADILCNGRLGLDHIGRIGGEEFLLIKKAEDNTNASSFFGDCCREIAGSPICTKAGMLNITVSIGVCLFFNTIATEELICNADNALYHAKARGRNCVYTWEV